MVGKVTVTVVDPLAQLAAAHSIKRPAKGKPVSLKEKKKMNKTTRVHHPAVNPCHIFYRRICIKQRADSGQVYVEVVR